MLLALVPCSAEVFMANGIKIGDVTHDTAKIRTRLTAQAERTRSGISFLKVENPRKQKPGATDGSQQIPEGKSLADMEGSVPGTTGEVRVSYWPQGKSDSKQQTAWLSVDVERDFTRQFLLQDLSSNTQYEVLVEGRNGGATVSLEGRFRTAPDAGDAEEINFVVVTCGDYPRRDDAENGHVIYDTMLKKATVPAVTVNVAL